MVVIIVGIISAAIAPIFTSGFQAFISARNLSAMSAGGELAMDRMSIEMRGIDPSADFNASTLPSATQFKFLQNGTTAVTYSVSGTSLNRNSNLLASNVQSLSLSYFNSGGTALTPPLTLANAQSIWLVTILLQLSTTQGSESLTTTIYLRSGPINR